jgi:hypothetical protein
MIRGIGPVCPNVECTFYETVFDISVEEPIAIKSRPQMNASLPIDIAEASSGFMSS